jgi:glycine cleavage system H lipoate-binding protein
MGYIESVKANCDIYSPVSGKVTAINGILTDEPGLINKSPEKEGKTKDTTMKKNFKDSFLYVDYL